MGASSIDMPGEAQARGMVLQVARVGIASYGVVYVVTGWIALQLAFSGGGGGQTSTTGALTQLSSQPLGGVLLWVVVVGLGAMALWQVSSIAWGESWLQGSDRTRERAKHAGRAVVYAVLALQAFRIATSGGSGGSGSGSREDSVTAALLGAPAGRVLVALVGLGIIAVGLYQLWSGVTRRFTEKLAGAGPTTVRLGQVGYVAKGVTLGLVGGLFGWAAVTADPERAGGMDQALQTLRGQAYGTWLLAAIGLGFVAYGIFCFAWARHPRP